MNSHKDLAELIEWIGPRPAAAFNNYLLIWAKELGGLSEELRPDPPVEAENTPVEQSEKSKSVIEESGE